MLSFPFPEQPNAMATASGDWVRLFFKGGAKEKRLPPLPSQADVEELLSCHEDTPHISPFPASTDAQNKSPRPPSVSPSLYTTYMSISLLPATCQRGHQSLSVCLDGRINGLSLEQVLTPLHWTRMEPPNRNPGLHHQHGPVQNTCAHLCIQS